MLIFAVHPYSVELLVSNSLVFMPLRSCIHNGYINTNIIFGNSFPPIWTECYKQTYYSYFLINTNNITQLWLLFNLYNDCVIKIMTTDPSFTQHPNFLLIILKSKRVRNICGFEIGGD